VTARFIVGPQLFTPEQCEALVNGVYEGRSSWTTILPDAPTLGRAFYTHLSRPSMRDLYVRDFATSDARVERFCPKLVKNMLAGVKELLSCNVNPVLRSGFCGPGVSIFPWTGNVAKDGGVIHFDDEGLPEDHSALRLPAYSFVCMIQKPERGGGIKLWDTFYESAPYEVTKKMTDAECEIIEYDLGELVAFDSYRLHQIQSFKGQIDRIAVTCHAMYTDRWEVWF
jgi:hypothetical protein